MSLGLGLSFGGMSPWDGEEAPCLMASSSGEEGINRAAALGSLCVASENLQSGHGPVPTKRVMGDAQEG